MTLSQLRVTPRPQAMKFKDRTPFRVDEVQHARLEHLRTYRLLIAQVGEPQARRITGQIVNAVALEGREK
jgi:hypothetical protein